MVLESSHVRFLKRQVVLSCCGVYFVLVEADVVPYNVPVLVGLAVVVDVAAILLHI